MSGALARLRRHLVALLLVAGVCLAFAGRAPGDALPSQTSAADDSAPSAEADDSAPSAAAPAEHDVARALDERLLRDPPDFCRRRGYAPNPRELALCSLAPAARARCPEFAAACERATRSGVDSLDGDSTWLQVIVWLVRGIGMLLLSALLAVLVMALFSLWLARAASNRAEPSDDGAAMPKSEPRAPPPEVVPERHLAAARALAAAGEYTRALTELHLAVLLHLSQSGLIHARPGRTNGEYARELSARPELQGPFRELSRAAEAVQFGGQRLDAAGFERLLGRATTLLPALLCLCLVAIGGLACGAPGAPAGAPGAGCGTKADGNALLCALVDAAGGSVHRRYRPLDTLDDSVDQIIVLAHELGEPSVAALERWVVAGGVLVLAAPLPRFDALFGLSRSERDCGPEASLGEHEPSRLTAIGTGLVAPRMTALAWCPGGEPYVAQRRFGDGLVIALPTPALLSNASLAAGDNARLLLGLLAVDDAAVELVGYWTHEAAENPLGQLHAAGLLPWLLQLGLLGVCFGLYRGAPFGRRREPPAPGRRRFSEHAVALGQRWSDVAAADSALTAYAGLAIECLRERLPAAAGQGDAELARAIADKTGRPVEAVLRTLERARRAQHGTPSTSASSEAEQLETLKVLGRLLEETGGGAIER